MAGLLRRGCGVARLGEVAADEKGGRRAQDEHLFQHHHDPGRLLVFQRAHPEKSVGCTGVGEPELGARGLPYMPIAW